MKGHALPAGGTIGVPAPSSPFEERSEIDRGVRWWEARGYHVKLGGGVYEQDDYVAGDPAVRARDLNVLFADPEVDVVQVLRGGYGASQVVPLLDYDVIAENPKPFVGYSDITALHVAIRQRTGLPTFYGVGLVGAGAKETTQLTRSRLLSVLRRRRQWERRRLHPHPRWRRSSAAASGSCARRSRRRGRSSSTT